MQRGIRVTRSRGKGFGHNNNGASRCGNSFVGSCWLCVIVKGNVDDSCGCAGDSAVSDAFFKDDVTAFNSCT